MLCIGRYALVLADESEEAGAGEATAAAAGAAASSPSSGNSADTSTSSPLGGQAAAQQQAQELAAKTPGGVGGFNTAGSRTRTVNEGRMIVAGVVSLGDIVRALLEQFTANTRYLKDYIHGTFR